MRNNNNDNNERPMRPRMAANSGPVRPAMPLLRSSLLRLAASSRQLLTRISLACMQSPSYLPFDAAFEQ